MRYNDPLPGVSDAAMQRIIMLDADAQDQVARRNGYEMRVFGRAFDLSASFEELEHLLEFFSRTKSFQEISLLIKLYIIGWVALSDILANLLNEIFDLGYADQDILFGVVMRNRRVRASQVPEVIRRHRKTIHYDAFVRRRNDIVHRGKLDDPEFMDVRGEVLSAVVLKRMRVDQNDPSAVDAATRQAMAECGAEQKTQSLLSGERLQFAEHLSATRAMLGDLAPVLIARIKSESRSTA